MTRKLAIHGAVLATLLGASPTLAQNSKPAPPGAAQADTEAQRREAARLQNQGRQAMAAGDYAAALPLFAECYRLHRAVFGDASNITLVSLSDYATALEELGRASEAEPLFAQVMQGFRQLNGERDVSTLAATSNYAAVLESLGRQAEAEPLYAAALASVRDLLGNRDPNTIAAITNHAGVLNDLGRSAEAEPLFAEALQLARAVHGDDARQTIAILGNYALVLENLARYAEAEELSAEALRLRRAVLGPEHPDTIAALGNHANLLNLMGRAGDAAQLAEQALQLRRQVLGERHPLTLNSLANYAVILRATGRAEDALPLYAEAYTLQEDVLGERHPDTIQSLDNYAGALSSLGRFEEALPLYEAAVGLRRAVQGERHPATLRSLNNYAVLQDRIGWADEALATYAEVLAISRETLGERHPETLTTQINYAIALKNAGRPDEAVPLIAQAAAVSREILGDRHADTLDMIANQALSLLDTGASGQALPLSRELASAYRSRAIAMRETGLRGQAQAQREIGDRQFAEKLLVDTLFGYVEDTRQDAAMDLAMEAFEGLQLASASSTSRAVAEAAAARFASGMGLQQLVQERQALAREWETLEAALVESQTGGADNAAARQALRARLAAIEPRVVAIDAQLAQQAPQYAAILNQQATGIEDLRAILDADEAVLFLVPTRSGTHVMALTRDGLEWVRANRTDADIEAAVADLRSSMEVVPDLGLPIFDVELAHALYADLIAPVAETLAGRTRLYVVADGALSRIPLGTLIASPPPAGADADDPEVLRSLDWLADRFALVQLPSVQSLVYIRRFGLDEAAANGGAYTGFGAPELGSAASTRGGRSGPPPLRDAASMVDPVRSANGKPLMSAAALRQMASLPGTATELARVREALNQGDAHLYLAFDMTETAIRSADLSATRVLHLATHGFTSEEAGSLAEPGLVFTPPAIPDASDDGYLAASEVVGIDLTAAEWVILSACNTASPSGRPGETGLSGLAQAFFYAGAQSLLVSHWPVFDDIAPVLTVATLRHWQDGMARAEALQAAQREVRNDPALDAAHPAVWAPFTLAGEGR